MSELILQFNPDTMTVSDLKKAALILRDLVQRRESITFQGNKADREARMMATFDTLTQNVKAP